MSRYQRRLLTEAIRAIEKQPVKGAFQADYRSLSLEQAIDKRTQLAELRYQIQSTLKHFQHLLKLLMVVMAVLFFIIGAGGVNQLLVNEQGTQINFFWVIILFIVPNLISLSIWLLLYLKTHLVNMSWVANLCLAGLSFIDRFHHKASYLHSYYPTLFRFFFSHRFSGKIGRSQLSLISHIWWGSYLLGATLSVVVILATHQVDFIWQTTILNEQVFLNLTALLTYLPKLLSIHVPTANDVLNANLGMHNSFSAAQNMRVGWANLLMFSLTVYALLPRVLLSVLFIQRIKFLEKSFKLDLSAPYYVQLKSILHPVAQSSFIKDADSEQADEAQAVVLCQETQLKDLPKQAYPIAVELGTKRYQQALKQVEALSYGPLLNVLDKDSQQQAITNIQTQTPQQVLIYVDMQRAPDRGWLSFVKQCRINETSQLYLVLLGAESLDPALLNKRLTLWCEKAAQANITQSQISYLLDKE